MGGSQSPRRNRQCLLIWGLPSAHAGDSHADVVLTNLRMLEDHDDRVRVGIEDLSESISDKVRDLVANVFNTVAVGARTEHAGVGN